MGRTCPWPDHYEATAREMIKEDSKDKLCGQFWESKCPSWCYHRQTLFSAFFWYPLILIAGLVLLIVCAVQLSVGTTANSYITTNCTTTTMEYRAGVGLECDCKKGKNSPACTRYYFCLNVMADYNVGTQNYTSPVFYEHGYVSADVRLCFYSPGKCEGEEDPNELLKKIVAEIPVNTTFTCYYHPEKPKTVVYQIQETGAGPWIMLAFGIPSLLFGFFLTCLSTILCSSKHLCKSNPTPEVIEEYNRKQAALTKAAGQFNRGFVGGPSRVAPVTPVVKQPAGPNNWERTNYGMDSGNPPPPPTYAAATEKKYDWE